MKRIVFAFMALCSVVAYGQSVTKHMTIEQKAMGQQKLNALIMKNDTSYYLMLRTHEGLYDYLTVGLGFRQNAMRLLKVMNEAELEKGDILNLENYGKNYLVRYNRETFTVCDEYGIERAHLMKKSIRAFIEALEKWR